MFSRKLRKLSCLDSAGKLWWEMLWQLRQSNDKQAGEGSGGGATWSKSDTFLLCNPITTKFCFQNSPHCSLSWNCPHNLNFDQNNRLKTWKYLSSQNSKLFPLTFNYDLKVEYQILLCSSRFKPQDEMFVILCYKSWDVGRFVHLAESGARDGLTRILNRFPNRHTWKQSEII